MVESAPVLRKRLPLYHPVRILQLVALFALLGYVGACIFLYSMQNTLTYPREGTGAVMGRDQAAREAASAGLVPWNETTQGAEGPQGYVPKDFASPAARGTIVVFHGNAGTAFERGQYPQAFARRGFRTFLYEYPGYGGRLGEPGEKVIVADGREVIRALDKAGYGPIYVWGESLGAGVAAAICADPTLPVHGLVLLTPWDNIANVGLSIYPYIPVRLLMTDKYDSIANLEKFAHPICVVRSDQDEVIPPPLSLNLFDHLPDPKKMILHANSGHSSWPSAPQLVWWDDALDFIAPKKN